MSTTTSLNLTQAPKFMGAYLLNLSSSLGLSVNPSTASITLVEDNDAIFTPPTLGLFYTVQLENNWSFSGVAIKYEKEERNIGGRRIQVQLNDVREVMKSIPMILAPGSAGIVEGLRDTHCAYLDIFGAFNSGIINLSGWNQAGIPYLSVKAALHGEMVRVGSTDVQITRQSATIYGETYIFDLTEVSAKVNQNFRINNNLISIAQFIEDLSTKNSFDWFVDAERQADNTILVTVRVIDRSQDNVDISFTEFLNLHEDRVISAASGLELRNDVSCLVLQGAPVESLVKVDIRGMANEPIDLSPEGGSNAYIMSEDEMRLVMADKNSWQMWLSIPEEFGGGGGFSRYGGSLTDNVNRELVKILDHVLDRSKFQNLPKNPERDLDYLKPEEATDSFNIVGKIYEKLKGHAESTYGKRWVHAPVFDEIIDSAWTADVTNSNDDPNDYFQQDNGRTRAYVEFSNEESGDTFSLGLSNLTNSFGNLGIFGTIIQYGNTFQAIGDPTELGAILTPELFTSFSVQDSAISSEKANYTYNNMSSVLPGQKTKIFVAATIDKDGVITIPDSVIERNPDIYEFLNTLVNYTSTINSNPTRSSVAIKRDRDNIQAQINREQKTLEKRQRELTVAANIANLHTEVNDPRNVVTAARAQKAQNKFDEQSNLVSELQQQLNDLNSELQEAENIENGQENNKDGFNDADGNSISAAEAIKQLAQQMLGGVPWAIAPRVFQPRYAYIPTRSRFNRYGPVFSSDITDNHSGKLEIIQDDGFAPWEFGGYTLMTEAMQIKVDNASSAVKDLQTGNISVEGYPIKSLGDFIGFNSNITSLSISFGNPVTTQYQLQSYTRKFGELTQEEIARLALATLSNRSVPQREANFIGTHNFRVNKQFGGKRQSAGGANSFE